LIDKKMWEEKFRKIWKEKKFGKDKGLILLLAGVLLLIIAMPAGEDKTPKEEKVSREENSSGQVTEEAYIDRLESRLEETLSRMDGAGNVTVMITLQSSSEKVVEKDTESDEESVTETDSQGGSRTTKKRTNREDAVYEGEEKIPYISKELSPRIEGVVVIAPGGDNAVVVKNITEAVQALFGIDTHKIRIVKGRREAN